MSRRALTIGVGLGVLGLLLAGLAMIPLLREVFHEPRTFSTGRSVRLGVEAGDRRMLWVRSGVRLLPACAVVDAVSGCPLRLEPVGGLHHDSSLGHLDSVARYRSTDGAVDVTCSSVGTPTTMYETTALDGAWAVSRLLWMFVPFLGCLLAGVCVLVVAARRRTAPSSRVA